MKSRSMCASILMASGMFLFAGCSAWGPSTKGTAQFDSSDVEGQSKSLAGVYQDVQSNGSIKPHLQTAGVEGRVNGLVILGGPADMPNVKTGQNEIKGTADQTPKVRIGDSIFPPKSERRGPSDETER